MTHISFSELKNWAKCAFYHKLVHTNGLKLFKGNEYTAFGTAVHNVCEKKLLKEKIDYGVYFTDSFADCIDKLPPDVTIDNKLVDSMVGQGKELLPEIEGALDDYFGDYEVLAVEMQLYEPIKTEEEYVFKGYIDAVVKTADGKHHIFDWKSTSWGWDARRRSEKIVTYQLTLY